MIPLMKAWRAEVPEKGDALKEPVLILAVLPLVVF